MEELVIKVPAPFAGTDAVGFSTRYPEQGLHEPLRDVTFFVEGSPAVLARLSPLLQRFPDQSRRAGQGYLWTDPILLSDELLVMAYRDRSVELVEPLEVARHQFLSLVQPLVIPFLRDCVTIADLMLNDDILLSLARDDEVLAELPLRLHQVLVGNGRMMLTPPPAEPPAWLS